MKRFISALLAAAVVLCLAPRAFADDAIDFEPTLLELSDIRYDKWTSSFANRAELAAYASLDLLLYLDEDDTDYDRVVDTIVDAKDGVGSIYVASTRDGRELIVLIFGSIRYLLISYIPRQGTCQYIIERSDIRNASSVMQRLKGNGYVDKFFKVSNMTYSDKIDFALEYYD